MGDLVDDPYGTNTDTGGNLTEPDNQALNHTAPILVNIGVEQIVTSRERNLLGVFYPLNYIINNIIDVKNACCRH